MHAHTHNRQAFMIVLVLTVCWALGVSWLYRWVCEGITAGFLYLCTLVASTQGSAVTYFIYFVRGCTGTLSEPCTFTRESDRFVRIVPREKSCREKKTSRKWLEACPKIRMRPWNQLNSPPCRKRKTPPKRRKETAALITIASQPPP
jgi:hypothetical protein